MVQAVCQDFLEKVNNRLIQAINVSSQKLRRKCPLQKIQPRFGREKPEAIFENQ